MSRMYVPRTIKGWARLLLFIGIFTMAIGIVFIVVFGKTGKLTDVSTVTAEEIQSKESYQIDEMYVLYQYASVPGSETMYMIVAYEDKTGELCYSAMTVYKSSAIFDSVTDYMEDDTQQMGDFAISGCFTANEIESDGVDFYNEGCDSLIAEIGGVKVPVDFSYRGLNEEEFKASNRGNRTAGIMVTAVGAVIFALAFFILRKMRPKKQKEVAYQPNQSYVPNVQTQTAQNVQAQANQTAQNVQAQANQTAQNVQAQANQTAQNVQAQATQAVQNAETKTEEAAQDAAEKMEAVTEQTEQAIENKTEKAKQEIENKTEEAAQDAAEKVEAMTEQTEQAIENKTEEAKQEIENKTEEAIKDAAAAVEDKPEQ